MVREKDTKNDDIMEIFLYEEVLFLKEAVAFFLFSL